MSKSKIVGIMALVAFAISIFLVGNAVAGEKHKLSAVFHQEKWEQMNVGEEEGHLIALWHGKGVIRNKEGKPFLEGAVTQPRCYIDLDSKAGLGSLYFYQEDTDRDGDKLYSKGPGTWKKGKLGPYWEGTFTFTGGTGKYKGIQGSGVWKNYPASPDLGYADWELDLELPR